jgi:hypothetical protein
MPDAPAPDVPGLEPGGAAASRLGWKAVLLATVAYVAAVCVTTYPFVLSFTKGIPGSLFDPLHHLWIMRWYKTCLLEWRSPVVCPDLQYPVGAPLGNFSTMHMQAILYFPLSFVFNDTVSFNIIWMTGLVSMGLGTMLLIWHVLRDRRVAIVGGLLAMVSGPMMLHSRSHLEILYVGCFPIFLVAWMRFVEAPSRGRLAAVVAAYVAVALCSPYYAVFVIVPAVLFLAWQAAPALRRRDRAWFASRARWVVGFALLSVPFLALIFGNQIWAMAHGFSLPRPMSEFSGYGCPPWTYVSPTILHRFSALMPVNPYDTLGPFPTIGERTGYLGVVTLFLATYALMTRAEIPRRAFWWTCLALFVVLASGAYWQVGDTQVKLPGYYLKKHVFLFKLIRVPGRYNLYVVITASLLAAAGLKRMLGNTRRGWARVAIVGGLIALALFDLQTRPYPACEIPEMPKAYAYMRSVDPEGGMVEVPQATAGGSLLYSTLGYWQAEHRLKTNAGMSGHGNFPFDNMLSFNSPFYRGTLANPDYAKVLDDTTFDIVGKVNALDYIWLYLHANKFRFVVVHEWAGATDDGDPDPSRLVRLKEMLAPAKVFEEPGVTVYDRERLLPPGRAVPLTTPGWRMGYNGRLMRVVGPEGRIAVYNPDPDRPVKFVLGAAGFPRAREVSLKAADGRELARWRVEPGATELYVSGHLTLPAGLQELVLESDGEFKPEHARQQALEWDNLPYSLWVSGIALIDAEDHDRQEREAQQLAAEGAAEGEEVRR